MKREGFSTRQLAAMKLPGAPGSHQGWEKHAVTHGWEIREHPGRGRGGIVREFMPPPAMAALIAKHQSGGKVSPTEVQNALGKLAPRTKVRRQGKGKSPSASVKGVSARDMSAARFAAWLMARVMAHNPSAAADELLQLDRHELALRVLMQVADSEKCALATLRDHLDIVDHAIALAVAVKPATAPRK